MGNNWMRPTRAQLWSEDKRQAAPPRSHCEPTFDPNFGFEAARKPKAFPISFEEAYATNIDLHRTDACAKLLIEYHTCLEINGIFGSLKCEHDKHALHHCVQTEHIELMKEYEREWRLRRRAARMAKKAAAETAEE